MLQKHNLCSWSATVVRMGALLLLYGRQLSDFGPEGLIFGRKGRRCFVAVKGQALFDADYLNKRPVDPKTGKQIKRFIWLILDEFQMAEG